MMNNLLRDLHRLRRVMRDCQSEIDFAPKVRKAQLARVAAHEKELADAKEDLKKRKAAILTGEAQIKSLTQSLSKHEKQLDSLSGPREMEAKQHDIDNAKKSISETEDQILAGMGDVDERSPKISQLEAALAKAKSDFAKYEVDSAERIARMKAETAAAAKELAAVESRIPPIIKSQYDRLVKGGGA